MGQPRDPLGHARPADPSSGELRGESLLDPTSALPEPAGFAELAETRLEISDMARDLGVYLHWLAERSESWRPSAQRPRIGLHLSKRLVDPARLCPLGLAP